MSLSISTSPAGPSLDGAAACASGTKGHAAGLPFGVLLDGQTAAGNGADAASEVDTWFGAALEQAEGGAAATPPAANPLAGLFGGLGSLGIRRLFSGNGEIGSEAPTLSALGKDKPANDAALFLLAAHDVLQRLESLQFAAGASASSANQASIDSSSTDDQLPPNLAAQLIEAESAASEAAGAAVPTATDSSTSPSDSATTLEEVLAKLAAQNGPDQARLPEQALSRPSVPPGLVLAEAIHAALGKGGFADQNQGFDQPSTMTGFDRRSAKSGTPAMPIAQAVATFDSTLKTASTAAPAPAPLPNQDGVVSSIVQTMRLQMRDGVGTAIVNLEPDYLGAVSIALRVENGTVTATMHAENPQVRAWMEANEGVLRESLAGQGLSLDRLLVTDERIADERSAGRRHRQEQEQHARQRPRRDDASTFEVIV